MWTAVLAPRSGSEQQGRRPVVILSNDGFNLAPTWRSIIVVPVSSSGRQAARGPTAVPLSQGTGGLSQDSVALCHQITTLDRAKLETRLGVLGPDVMLEIEEGLRAALDFSS